MALLNNFTDFRGRFALRSTYVPSGPDPVQFTAPNIIERTGGGDWEADDFEAGQRVQPVGSASNDQYFTIGSIINGGAQVITVEDEVTTEGPLAGGVTFDGVFIDPGGFERFDADSVNAPGGPGPLTGLFTPWVPMVGSSIITVNGGAVDAVPTVDEYDWFVSLRTEVPADQVLTVFEQPLILNTTFSGTLRIDATALGKQLYGLTVGVPLTPFQTAQLFKNVDVYCKRLSDGLIFYQNLLVYQTIVDFP